MSNRRVFLRALAKNRFIAAGLLFSVFQKVQNGQKPTFHQLSDSNFYKSLLPTKKRSKKACFALKTLKTRDFILHTI
jgi:hypothetical protein